MSLIWRLLRRNKPSKNSDRRSTAAKAFQQLWVAGTLGAFFTALARNLPLHLSQLTFAPDWAYTLAVLLKYGYLIWLLSYFFMSALRNEQPDANRALPDIGFDVMQSLCSLTAAYFLGFIIPTKDHGPLGYALTNLAILIIAGLSLWLFHERSRERINPIRIAGGLIAAIGIVVSLWPGFDTGHLLGLAVLQLMLWILLYPYVRIGIDESAPRPDAGADETGCRGC